MLLVGPCFAGRADMIGVREFSVFALAPLCEDFLVDGAAAQTHFVLLAGEYPNRNMFVSADFSFELLAQGARWITIWWADSPAAGTQCGSEKVGSGFEEFPAAFAAVGKAGIVDAIRVDIDVFAGEQRFNQSERSLSVPSLLIDVEIARMVQPMWFAQRALREIGCRYVGVRRQFGHNAEAGKLAVMVIFLKEEACQTDHFHVFDISASDAAGARNRKNQWIGFSRIIIWWIQQSIGQRGPRELENSWHVAIQRILPLPASVTDSSNVHVGISRDEKPNEAFAHVGRDNTCFLIALALPEPAVKVFFVDCLIEVVIAGVCQAQFK